MADIIGLGASVIDIASYIRSTYDEVKAFPERSKRLSNRIDSLLPAVRLLQDSVIADAIRALEENEEVKIKVFHNALVELEQCVKSAKDFMDSLITENWLQRAMKKETIKGQYDSFSERLDVLQNTIQFGIMVEMRQVILSQSSDDVKRKKEEFKRGTKEAFHKRQEMDLKDEQEDEKKLMGLLQGISEDQKEQGVTLKQIAVQVKEIRDAQKKTVTANPVGFDLDQVKIISTSELKHMKQFTEGSLGMVYKAQYLMEDVAVKRLQPDMKANLAELNAELRKEAENLKKFDSKHVVRLWGIVTEDEKDPMIVFEYMSQGTLRQFLDHMKANNMAEFSWKKRIHMALGGALGLYRIHNMQPPMLHCAIGSDKFLVNSNWEIKIHDVGFAKTRSSAGRNYNKKKNLSTKYFAPEHLMGNKNKYDERSELYGYGIVMWEIATCEEPFRGMDAGDQTIYLAVKKEMESLPNDCPKCFADIINKNRSLDRFLRPVSGELVELLQQCDNIDY